MQAQAFVVPIYTGGKPRNYHENVLTLFCSQATSGIRRGSFQAVNLINKGSFSLYFYYLERLVVKSGNVVPCKYVSVSHLAQNFV